MELTSAATETGGATSASGRLRAAILGLMDEKTELEARIASAGNILMEQNVGMDDPLVDDEGYPRSDIDVYAVRHARSQLRRLQNDHRALMLRIEAGLAEMHAQVDGSTPEDEGTVFSTAGQLTPFLQVGAVCAGSPADLAGLQSGDHITSMGSVNGSNFQTMADVASVVRHSNGRLVRLTVMRSGRLLNLELTPRTWSGAGLLGCSLLPIDHPER